MDLMTEHLIRQVRAESAPKAKTREDLKAHMLELIRVRSQAPIAPAAVAINELNRRFGVTAHRMGTTARTLLVELAEEGVVRIEPYKQSFLVYDNEAIAAYLSPFLNEPDDWAKLKTEILRRAFKSYEW